MINQTFEHLRDYVVSIELIPTCLVYIFKRLLHAMYSTPLLISCLHTLWGYQRHASLIDLSAVQLLTLFWVLLYSLWACQCHASLLYFLYRDVFLWFWILIGFIITVKGQEHLSFFPCSFRCPHLGRCHLAFLLFGFFL